jgi:hypothetical protein
MDQFAKFVARLTEPLTQSRVGQLLISLIIFIGPISFLPTVWEAWTNPNISGFRTLTWPVMVIVNVVVFISLCHNGENKLRWNMVVWVALMGAVWLATLVR